MLSCASSMIKLYLFFFSFIMIILVPLGDEPDFYSRIERINSNNFFNLFHDYININNITNCINYSRLDLFQNLNINCALSNHLLLYSDKIIFCFKNLLLTIFIIELLKIFKIYNTTENKLFYLCLFFPFSTYIFSCYSDEYYSNIILLLFFCFSKTYFRILALIALLIIDYDGQFPIIILYLFVLAIVKILDKKIKKIYLLIYFLIFLHFFNVNTIKFFMPVIYDHKFDMMITASRDFLYKYNLFERFSMVILSFFMTAKGLKFSLVFVYFVYILINNFKNVIIINNKNSVFSIYITILFFINIFPTHTNAKYYLFVLPIILKEIICIYGYKKIYSKILFMNVICCGGLLIKYL